jgi:hypothetical protein
MDLSGIIAISGKAGLFKVVAQGKNNIIVESLIDNKRFPAYASDRVSALDDISIYTYDKDIALKDLLQVIYKRENGKTGPSHKEDIVTLKKYLLEILPNYDQERVYPSDVKKMFQWYNLLLERGLLDQPKEEKSEKAEKTKKDNPDGEKASKTKKEASKNSVKAKPTATKTKVAKPSTPKKSVTTKTGSSRGK